MSSSTRDLVAALYDAYARSDGVRIAELLADDIEFIIHAPPQIFAFAGRRHGKAAVLDALASLAKEYALERYDNEIVIVEGDRAAVSSRVAFKQRSTGRTLSFRNVNLLRFRDGRVIEFREFIDTFDAVEQALGHHLAVAERPGAGDIASDGS